MVQSLTPATDINNPELYTCDFMLIAAWNRFERIVTGRELYPTGERFARTFLGSSEG